jgi:DNA-binding NarL/FixJ family response regulator
MTFLLDVANAAVRYDGANNDMVFKRERKRVLCVMSQRVSALIIARPGHLRDGLQTLLQAVPEIALIQQADVWNAFTDAYHRPSLVLLDIDPQAPDTVALLQQIKRHWPQTSCIALVDSEQDLPREQLAGADVTLLKGVLASRLFDAINDLLAHREE